MARVEDNGFGRRLKRLYEEALYLDVDRDVDFEEKLIRVRGAISYSNDIHGTVTGGKNENAIQPTILTTVLTAYKLYYPVFLSVKESRTCIIWSIW